MQKQQTLTPAGGCKTKSAAASLQKMGFNLLALRPPYKHIVGDYFAKKNGKLPRSVLHIIPAYFKRTTAKRAFDGDDNTNIAILTGKRHNLIVIDVDYPQGGKESMQLLDLPQTLTAQTGNGIHLYYRHPGGMIPTSAGRLAPGIDVKGEYSFATAPPSLHPSGRRYRWIDQRAEIADLPPATVEALRALPHRGMVRDMLHILAMCNILLPLSAALGLLLRRNRHGK